MPLDPIMALPPGSVLLSKEEMLRLGGVSGETAVRLQNGPEGMIRGLEICQVL